MRNVISVRYKIMIVNEKFPNSLLKMDFTHSLFHSFSGAEQERERWQKANCRIGTHRPTFSPKSHFPQIHILIQFSVFSHNAEFGGHISSRDFATTPLSHIDLKLNNFFFAGLLLIGFRIRVRRLHQRCQKNYHFNTFGWFRNIEQASHLSSVLSWAPITINKWRILIRRKESGESFAV